MSIIDEIVNNPKAQEFCEAYLRANPNKRYILGRNVYAKSIADAVEVAAFIDDFTDETEFQGKPVIRTRNIPHDALVVSSLLGKPWAGEKLLEQAGVRHLDFFAFYESSGLNIPPVRFWGRFKDEYAVNEKKFRWIKSLFSDEASKKVYDKIVHFRLSGNLAYMEGFTDRQNIQYFENFLDLNKQGEVFVDAGGYDGYTSLEFIKRCPDFNAIYLFEPDARNMVVAESRLAKYANIHFMRMGLSDKRGVARFFSSGSVSTITSNGDIEIQVDALDSIVDDTVTFIKIDIEGAEGKAIDGARSTILKNHPRLAICVYHNDEDFWKIPEQILSLREDYNIYLRHYTEGVAETVMFFIPKTRRR